MKYGLFTLFLVFGLQAFAQGASTGGSKMKKIFSVGAMALNSSTFQGGAGPSGSTLLTHSEFVLGWQYVGLGVVFDYDRHGTNEIDSAQGIKLETYITSKFYLEVAYLLSVKRAYTDRSIAEETGTGLQYGLGFRFPLGSGGANRGSFFHASYKVKQQTLKMQDGVEMSEPITQNDGYPIFGFGFTF